MPRRTVLVTAMLALAALTSGTRLTGQATPPPGQPASPGAPAQTDPQFTDVDKLCDARNQALRSMGDGSEKGLDDLTALINSAEKEAVKEPELATAATATPPAKVVEEAKTARESVKLNLTLGKQAQAEATQEVQLARRATDPAEKVKHYAAALAKAEHAESLMQKVAKDLAPYTPQARPHTVNSEALDKLRAMTKALENGGSSGAQLATLRDGFDGDTERLRAEVVRRPQTEFFTGAPRGYVTGTLTLGNGRRVDVSALERASAPPSGQTAPRPPLFREVPSPTGSRYVIDAAAANRARASAASPQVGGVALQVTLLALGAAGVPGFESAGELEGVDETVMISLQRLLRRAQPFAADATRWATMPEDLRYPGGIERIIGYVLDPARGDVILLGTPASRPQARLDLDALVLGLRASWRDDTPPFVSLDPWPLQPDGDQLSRIGGVPEDSIMAKVMLDADYMMKGMMLGARPTGLASYKNIVQLMQENPATLTRPWHARFWFYPKPLGAAAVHLSGSGRTLVFNAELQVLTEQMATQSAAFVNTTGTSVEDMAAQQFSRSLDALATGGADSGALLARLRGMTGAVTLGTLLRKNGVTYQVLKDFSGLPYRRLSARDAAPRAYARLATDYEAQVNGRRVRMSIGGGVSLVPRPHRNRREGGVDLLASKIEGRIDAGALQNADAVREPTPMVFTRTVSSSIDQRVDAALVRGSNAFRRGQFDVASREFRSAADLDPSSVEAHLNLAFSFDRMGRPADARTAIRTAHLLDPDDTGVQLVDTAISVHANRAAATGIDRKTRRDLIRLYSLHARSALNDNDGVAESWANEAIALEETPVPADAYLTRGFARFKRTPEPACVDIKKAWDATEYVGLSGVAFDDDQKIYAFASLGLSSCAVGRMQRALATGNPGPTLFRSLAADMKKAVDLLRPAQKMFPTFSMLFSASLMMESDRYMMLDLEFTPEGRRSEQARLTGIATDLIQRFPLASESYSTAGEMYLDFKATDRAIATCTSGLAVRPNDLGCLTVRMTALSAAGRCTEARADAAAAQQNVQFAGLPPEFTARCGRP